MVASIACMKGSPSQIAAYYTAEAAWEYYAGEHNGTWIGSAAAHAGVSGFVTRDQLQRLLCGQNGNGDTLVKRKPIDASSKKRSRCGYDITFSAPKSVSAIWSAASTEDRLTIEQAIRTAVEKTFTSLEEQVPLARRGRGGSESIDAKLLAGMFLHTISRNMEPQLHVHATVLNMCLGSDGRWSAVNSRVLHQWTPTLGRIFRCNLANELKQNLKVDLYRPKQKDGQDASWFEVKGVSKSLIDQWSSRRKAIIEKLDGGRTLGNSTGKARQQANLRTRKKKEKNLDQRTLIDAWRSEAAKHGLNSSSIERLKKTKCRSPGARCYAEAFNDALSALTKSNAHFSSREVVQEVCERLQHLGVDGRQITSKVIEDLRTSSRTIPLSGQHRGEDQFTTKSMWKLEKKLLDDVAQLRSRAGAHISDRDAEAVMRQHDSLTQQQKQSASRLLTEKAGVKTLTGVAGAGKSYTLNAVRDGLEKNGFRVIGGAISGAAKEELVRQTQIESRTVASYLYRLEQAESFTAKLQHDLKQIGRQALGKPTFARPKVGLDEKTAVILDEAAMLDTRSLERLVHHIKKAGATLILAGDACQLPPIGAGAPMAHIVRTHGSVSLTQNLRQQNAEDRQAVANIRQGEAAKAIQSYAERGRLRIGEDRTRTIDDLISSWKEAGGHRRPIDHVIFTQTRAEAHELNVRCQKERLGALGALPGLSTKSGDERFHIGDRVLFHKPFRSQFIENGYRGTVIAVDPFQRQLKVRLDHEPSKAARAKGASRIATVPLKRIGADGITLGYAATTHRMQGQTAKNSFLLLGGAMTDREMAYVQTTRAKLNTKIFVDAAHAGDDFEDLAKSINKSRGKLMAHDLGKKQEQLRPTIELRPELGQRAQGV